VIDPANGQKCQSSFAISSRKRLEDAIGDLRCREGTVLRRIGFVDLDSGAERSSVFPDLAGSLRKWAQDRGFASVVWTDLPSNFNEDGRGLFSVERAAEHLRKLTGDGPGKAKEYISRAPENIRTPLRAYLEQADWWGSYGVT